MTELTKKERVIACPHCQGMILVQISTALIGLEKYSEADARALKDLQPDQKAVFEEIQSSGLLDTFGKTARFVHGDQCPKNITRYFRNVVGSVLMRKIPRFALDMFREEISTTGQLQFWTSQGIGMVVIDNSLRAFVPTDMVLGQIARSPIAPVRSIITTAAPEQLKAWFADNEAKLKVEQWAPFIRLRKACV